jgi:hypothetical protein
MSPSTHQDHKGTTGGPLDISEKDVLQPSSDRQIKGGKEPELDPDELARLDATAELSREKNDAYIVRSDLDDAEERGPSPGMKDQDDQA